LEIVVHDGSVNASNLAVSDEDLEGIEGRRDLRVGRQSGIEPEVVVARGLSGGLEEERVGVLEDDKVGGLSKGVGDPVFQRSTELNSNRIGRLQVHEVSPWPELAEMSLKVQSSSSELER